MRRRDRPRQRRLAGGAARRAPGAVPAFGLAGTVNREGGGGAGPFCSGIGRPAICGDCRFEFERSRFGRLTGFAGTFGGRRGGAGPARDRRRTRGRRSRCRRRASARRRRARARRTRAGRHGRGRGWRRQHQRRAGRRRQRRSFTATSRCSPLALAWVRSAIRLLCQLLQFGGGHCAGSAAAARSLGSG